MRPPARPILSVTVSLVLLALVGLPPAPVAAQDESGIGVEVGYVDRDGVTRGIVQVVELIDPFLDLAPDAPSLDGDRRVGLLVMFTAADDQTLEVDPTFLQLRDTAGFVWRPASIARPPDVAVPDLEAQTMAPGDRVSGFVGYVVPDLATIHRVEFVPDSYRAIALVNVGSGSGPAPGSSVAVTNPGGGEASLTVGVVDPFTDFDPARPPDPGNRYIGLRVVVENSGDEPFDFEPAHLYVQTTDGHLLYPSSVPRQDAGSLPDLEGQRTAPGDRISGFVGFVVPEEKPLESIVYWPSADRRITVARPAGAGEPIATP
jgi:hypothetical protein